MRPATLILAATTSLATGPALAADPAPSGDPEAGQALHQEHCMRCHGGIVGGEPNEIYTREDRRIHNYPSLVTQVRRCEVNLNLAWFDEDVDDVATYLNQAFYHF